MDDLQVRAAATDIFSYLVEFSPSMVREFVMQEPQQTDDVSIFTSPSTHVPVLFRFNGGVWSDLDYISQTKEDTRQPIGR